MAFRAAGLRFGYHNHDFEAHKVDGDTTVLDLIVDDDMSPLPVYDATALHAEALISAAQM